MSSLRVPKALTALIGAAALSCASPKQSTSEYAQTESSERSDQLGNFGYFNIVRWDSRDLILSGAGKSMTPRTFNLIFTRQAPDGTEAQIIRPTSYTLEENQDALSVTLPSTVQPGDIVACEVDGMVAGQKVPVPPTSAGSIPPIKY